MSSTTFAPGFAAASTADTCPQPAVAPAKSSLWTTLYGKLIEARQAQANAIVARHVALHADASLKAIGWTDAEIAILRRRHTASRR